MKRETQAEKNSYKYSYGTNKRYRTFDGFVKERFGGKCVKITLDGGFSCPNTGGGKRGCDFCVLPGRRDRKVLPLCEQYRIKKEQADKKWPGALNISYLSDYSGTYAKPEKLRSVYDEALALPDTVGLFVGTRPDCLDDERIDLLREYDKKTFFVCEVGIESTKDETLADMHRGHNASCGIDALRRLKEAGIKICPHVIFGLPGESREDMLRTVSDISAQKPEFIKIHMLYIAAGTPLAERYEREKFKILSKEEYVSAVCDALEILPPDTVVERLTGDGLAGELIAPDWSRKKVSVINDIDKEMYRRDTVQGMRFAQTPSPAEPVPFPL